MPYFQLRITCTQLRTRAVVLRAIKALIRHYKLECYSTGYEELNKYGEPCDPHVHFHFLGDIDRLNPKRCMGDWLRRHFANQDIELKGNKMWSLKMVEEPDDFCRWFRYTLKEGLIMDMIKCDDCDEIQEKGLENVIKLAENEKADSIEQNILRREKLANKDKFKQKMYEFIDEERKEGDTEKRVIWCLIFEYYRKIEKPINFSTIEGYCNLWLADHGQLSAINAFDLFHNNNCN